MSTDHAAFWAAYTGSVRVDLGHGFWVDLKKSLSAEDDAAIKHALTAPTMRAMNQGEIAEMEIDQPAYERELVFRSIADWNLMNEQGQELPKNRNSLKQLPGPVFRQMLEKAQELNNEKRSPTEQQNFRGESAGGDLDGGGGSPGIERVLSG